MTLHTPVSSIQVGPALLVDGAAQILDVVIVAHGEAGDVDDAVVVGLRQRLGVLPDVIPVGVGQGRVHAGLLPQVEVGDEADARRVVVERDAVDVALVGVVVHHGREEAVLDGAHTAECLGEGEKGVGRHEGGRPRRRGWRGGRLLCQRLRPEA